MIIKVLPVSCIVLHLALIRMTDAQRHLFANKMSEMPEMGIYSQGTESYQQFAIRIADMLLEPEKFRELYPILEKSGFQP
ncbi:DNA replication protein [Acinetobacter baumannii]|nr:hypothetical protein APC40_05705 [Acinetobacter baumannii]CAA0183850.1 DNA replication protein [Acinetobacter baumannii]